MITTSIPPLPMKGRDVPVPAPIGQKLAGQQRNRWLARGAGLLASALAAVPLGGLLAYALIFIALAGGGTLGGYGAAAEAADAPWAAVCAEVLGARFRGTIGDGTARWAVRTAGGGARWDCASRPRHG